MRMGTRNDGHAPKGQCRNQWLFRAWVSSRPASIRPSLKVSFDTAKKINVVKEAGALYRV